MSCCVRRVLLAAATWALAAAAPAAAAPEAITTPDGYTVNVDVSPSLKPSERVPPQVIADLLYQHLHGPELDGVNVFAGTFAEMSDRCGGGRRAVACYRSAEKLIVITGYYENGQLGEASRLTHEYGHHISYNSAQTADPLYPGGDWGLKNWASYKLVCDGVARERYFPGDAGEHYLENPAESFAETYARLYYPEGDWSYEPTLAPDDGAFAAIRRDVESPWSGGVDKTYKSKFTRGRVKKFNVPLNLDGKVVVDIEKEARGLELDLAVAIDGDEVATSGRRGGDRVTIPDACRSQVKGKLQIIVFRRHGKGRFNLFVHRAG
jgi:hypothetical protein